MNKTLENIRVVFYLVFFSVSTVLYADNTGENKMDRKLFTNQELLDSVFEKLYLLENNGAWKFNIAHIGDSHIQADFLTNTIRIELQKKFGDGGYGFTFPYTLTRTNGSKLIKYSSNITWSSRLNVSPISALVDIGLSGIGMYTNNPNFDLHLYTEEKPFNTIKILYSTEEPQYNLSLTPNPKVTFVEEIVKEREQLEHRIKHGETISAIATHYKVTVKSLMEENGLKSSDYIQAGRSLRIPIAEAVEIKDRVVKKQKIDYVDAQNYPYYTSYLSREPLKKISVFPKGNTSDYDISGFVLENDKPGLIYHALGVNGAKVSDYNKYALFFKHLNVIKPGLVILSFGTNESYQQLPVEKFISNLKEMIAKIQRDNPNTIFIIMTPPPSLMRRRMPNPLIEEYSRALVNLKDVVVWDLYKFMHGEAGIRAGGKYERIIAKDKIHYTLEGYKVQGEMFANDFLEAYQQYKKRRNNN